MIDEGDDDVDAEGDAASVGDAAAPEQVVALELAQAAASGGTEQHAAVDRPTGV